MAPPLPDRFRLLGEEGEKDSALTTMSRFLYATIA